MVGEESEVRTVGVRCLERSLAKKRIFPPLRIFHSRTERLL